MPVCTFCKNAYEFPRGTTVVQKDGNVKFYCSSKCRKNNEMKRDNKKVKWIRKSDIVKQEKAKKEESKQKLKETQEKVTKTNRRRIQKK